MDEIAYIHFMLEGHVWVVGIFSVDKSDIWFLTLLISGNWTSFSVTVDID